MAKEPVFPQYFQMRGGGYITVHNKMQLAALKNEITTAQAQPIEAIPADIRAAVAAAEAAEPFDPVPTPGVNETDAQEITAQKAAKTAKAAKE